MTKQPSIFGKWEVFFITTILLFNERLITIPRLYAEKFEQDSWVAMILGGVIAMIFGWLFYRLISKGSKEENLYDLVKIILGKVFGNIVIVIFSAYLIFSLGFSLRTVTDGTHSFLLDRTPSWAIMASYLLIVIYLVNCGLSTMAKFYVLSFAVTIIGIILIILMPITNYKWERVLPVLPEGLGRIIKGLPWIFTSYMGFGLLGFIIPKSEDKRLGLPFVGGIFMVMVLETLILLSLTAFFGPEELKHAIFPVLNMAKGIELKGLVIERAETIFALVWIPITFNAFTAQFYMADAAIMNFLPGFKKVFSMMILAIIILVIALIPKSVSENMYYSSHVELFGALYMYSMITILLIIAKIRGIKGND